MFKIFFLGITSDDDIVNINTNEVLVKEKDPIYKTLYVNK